MVRIEIEIDEDTERILTELASEYEGDWGQGVADLVQAHAGLEAFVEESKAAHAAEQA